MQLNTFMYKFLCTYACIFHSPGYTLGVELLGHVKLMFTILKVVNVKDGIVKAKTGIRHLKVNRDHQLTLFTSHCSIMQQPNIGLNHLFYVDTVNVMVSQQQ